MTELQQEKVELQAQLQKMQTGIRGAAARRGAAGSPEEQLLRVTKDAAVLVSGMYELERDYMQLLEGGGR